MPSPPRRLAVALFLLLVVAYNANGRESGSSDTQAARYLAREVAVRHTLTLDATIAAQPLLGERAAFVTDRNGHWRPAYGIVPVLLAAIPATILHAIGLVDMAAPFAPNLMAVVTASLLTAGAVVLVFLALTRVVSIGVALVTSLALGLGTNYWAIVSQTLWQHETVAFGVALALWAWWRVDPLPRSRLLLGAAGLALVGAAATLEVGRNLVWFGHVLGATTGTESLHPVLHGVPGPLAEAPWWNALGLLISPSRGLLIYSPVVIVAMGAMVMTLRRRQAPSDLQWLAAAIVAQCALYSCYAVWWAGHTFGPRYLLDVLVPLAPFGAIGAAALARRRWARRTATLLLVWSIVVAGLGAFVYPNERWNTNPLDIDRHHFRLWDWRDTQISRALRSRPSPQNFNLFGRATVRQDRS